MAEIERIELRKPWPGAAEELSAKLANGESVKLWLYDIEHTLTVHQVTRVTTGFKIELRGPGITVMITTAKYSNDVTLLCFSKRE